METVDLAQTESEPASDPVVIHAKDISGSWTITMQNDSMRFASEDGETFAIPRSESAKRIKLAEVVAADNYVIRVDARSDWKPRLMLVKSEYVRLLEWNPHLKDGDLKRMLRGLGWLLVVGSLYLMVRDKSFNLLYVPRILLGIADIVFPRREILVVNAGFFLLAGVFSLVSGVAFFAFNRDQSQSIGIMTAGVGFIQLLASWYFFRKSREPAFAP